MTLKNLTGKHAKYLPYAFTGQGVAMLSGVLHSDKAINMNITILRAFVEIKKLSLQETNLKDQLKQIQKRVGENDLQPSEIYDDIANYWMKRRTSENGKKEKGSGSENKIGL